MLTGEIWFADLDPSEGFEQSGKRPVLIISGNAMNSKSGLVIVCPFTSKVKNYSGNIVLMPDEVNGLSMESEILTFQIRTISSTRLIKKIGSVSKDVHSLVLKNFIKICTY
jgi:mRNA interferase MazF